MKREELFEALGEISSKTVQINTIKGYRERVLASYIRLASAAAAIIVVGTGIFVFRIVDTTHGIKEQAAESIGVTAADGGELYAEEAASEDAFADEAPNVEMPVAEASDEAEHKEASAEMPAAEAAEEAEEVAPAEDIMQSESAVAVKDDSNGMLQKEKDFDPLFASIDFPANSNWIKISSHSVDNKNIEVNYKDLIAEADCTLVGIKGGKLALPGIDYGNATTITREYTSSLDNGKKKNTAVTLKKSENAKDVLVTWEYEDYRFAIIAEFTGKSTDADPIMKTAYYIIDSYMNTQSIDKGNAKDVEKKN